MSPLILDEILFVPQVVLLSCSYHHTCNSYLAGMYLGSVYLICLAMSQRAGVEKAALMLSSSRLKQEIFIYEVGIFKKFPGGVR